MTIFVIGKGYTPPLRWGIRAAGIAYRNIIHAGAGKIVEKSCEPGFLHLSSQSFLFFQPLTQLFYEILRRNDLQHRPEGQNPNEKRGFILPLGRIG